MQRKLIPLLTPLFLASASLVASANSVPSQPTSASTGQPGNAAGAQNKAPDEGQAKPLSKPDPAGTFGEGPVNPDQPKEGPWTGKRAGKKQAGAGGYNQVVVNPGKAIAPQPRSDESGNKDSVPTPDAIRGDRANRAGETDYRKSRRVGTGNTSDNSRLDPATGAQVLPNTESSSNPGNPKAPPAPGGSDLNRTVGDDLRGGQQNVGAYADMALPAPGGSPDTIVERARSLAVTFAPGQAKLDAESQQKIDALLTEARAAGSIAEIKVVSWADQNATPKQKLPKQQVELASNRAEAIEGFLKQKISDTRVSSLNMAKGPGILERLVGSSNQIVRDRLAESGLDGTPGGKASHAMVMVIMKR